MRRRDGVALSLADDEVMLVRAIVGDGRRN
jgi:hypothetical protein